MNAQLVILFSVFLAVFTLSIPHPHGKSGVSNTSKTKIAGGENVTKPIPYQAGLLLDGHFCSGALIHEQWVITSADCGMESNDSIVILGALDITQNETTQIVVRGNYPVFHPDWNYDLYNDVALIKLEYAINITDAIKPAKLPTADNPDYDGVLAQVTGWGEIPNGPPGGSHILQKAENPILNNSDCERFYGESITEHIICMDGSHHKGICYDDFGDPLAIVEEDGEAVVVGVAIGFSLYGCEVGYPSIFTRTGSFRNWIEETIRNN